MSQDLVSLESLAVQINALDEQANYHAGQAVVYAAKCGEKLLLAKAQCKHGEFGDWLSKNCRVKERQAQKYISLAKEYPHLIDDSKPHRSADLMSINQAIALLSATEDVKTEVTERIEAGEQVTVKEIQDLKRQAKDAEQKLQKTLIELNQEKETSAAIKEQRDRMNSEQQARIRMLDKSREKYELEKQQEVNAAIQRERENVSAAIEAKNKEIEEYQRKLDKAKNDKEAAIKNLEKDIDNQVQMKISERDSEIRILDGAIHDKNKVLAELNKALSELEKNVGDIAIHKKYTEQCKEALLLAKSAIDFSKETGHITDSYLNVWENLLSAFDSVAMDIRAMVDDSKDFATIDIIAHRS